MKLYKAPRIFLSKLYYVGLSLIYRLLFTLNSQQDVLFIKQELSGAYGNLDAVQDTLTRDTKQKQSKENNLRINVISAKDGFCVKKLKAIAKAKVIVLDQADFLISKLKISSNTKVIQVWHAAGAYKKVGFDAVRKNRNLASEITRITRIHRNYNYFIVSAESVRDIYAQAFCIPKERVLALGTPRLDEYFLRSEVLEYQNHNNNESIISSTVTSADPDIKQVFNHKVFDFQKLTLLYAPTFRTSSGLGRTCLNLKQDTIDALFPKYNILVRAHPGQNFDTRRNVIDVTELSQSAILRIADVLVTDYSSIMFDFCCIKNNNTDGYNFKHKPIIILAQDIDNYIQNERGLYFAPTTLEGVNVVSSEEMLVTQLLEFGNFYTRFNNKDNKDCLSNEKVLSSTVLKDSTALFNKFLSANDGFASKRVSELILKLLEE